MASLNDILKALRNADAAGDVEAAVRLAQMADAARKQKPADPSKPATFESEAGALIASANKGVIARGLGAPVDIATGAVNFLIPALGPSERGEDGSLEPAWTYQIEEPVGGSQWIENRLNDIGVETNVPARSGVGRVAQRAVEEAGAMALPFGAARSLGTAASRVGPLAERAVAAFSQNPLAQFGVATTAGTGAGIANEIAPGNKWAELAGLLLGGGAGIGAIPIAGAVQGLWRGGQNVLGLQSPQTQASSLLASALRRDSATPATIQTRMEEAQGLGVPFASVDAAGRNTVRLGRTVETAPGAGSQTAAEYLSNRQLNQAPRVVEQLSKTLADPTVFKQATDALFKVRSTAARPLYEEAFAMPVDMTPRLQQFLSDPILQQGLSKGREIQRLEMVAEGATPPPPSNTLTMRDLDAAKRGLDDILEEYRVPETGRLLLDDRGRAIEQVRKAYVAYLDELNPKYAEARSAWGGPSEALDAMASGRRYAKGDIEDMVARFNELDPTMREFFRIGLARELRSIIDKGGESADAVRRIFGTRDAQNRLRQLFPSEDAFSAFAQAMRLEQTTGSTTRTILGGSPTARITAEGEDANLQMLQDVAQLATGTPPTQIGSGWLRKGIDRARGVNEATAEELARVLFSEDPRAVGNLLSSAAPRQPWAGNMLKNVLTAQMLRQMGAQYGE